jgi:hypothetical protein
MSAQFRPIFGDSSLVFYWTSRNGHIVKWVYSNFQCIGYKYRFCNFQKTYNYIHLTVSGLGTMMGSTGRVFPLILNLISCKSDGYRSTLSQNKRFAFNTQHQPYPFTRYPFTAVQIYFQQSMQSTSPQWHPESFRKTQYQPHTVRGKVYAPRIY